MVPPIQMDYREMNTSQVQLGLMGLSQRLFLVSLWSSSSQFIHSRSFEVDYYPHYEFKLNMKLPSINQRPEKPNSAQSQRSTNLPPKNRSLVDNLERNLFKKFQQYDELHQITTYKPVSDTKLDLLQESFQSNQKEPSTSKNKEPYQGEYREPYMQYAKEPISVKEPAKEPAKRLEEPREPVRTSKAKPTKEAFITAALPEPESGSEDEDQVAQIERRNRTRLELRKQLVNNDDDLSEVNALIQQTNSEMSDYYSSAGGIKRTLTLMSENARQLGMGVRPELLDKLEQQFQELLKMQQDDDALDEFELQELKQRKTRGPLQQKTAGRPASLAHSNKRR